MDQNKFNGTIFEEIRNPWFWFYLISLVIFTIVWFIPIPWKTINIIGAFGAVGSQLIYNLKVKMDEKIMIFSKFIRWAYFIVLLLFAITYTSAILKEISISIISLLTTFSAILLGAVILNFSNLFKSRWPWEGAWNYVSFSSSMFYSNMFGEVPFGISKLFSHVELAFSFVVHIIVLGFIINSKSNKFKK